MFRFAPYVLKTLWRHRTRTALTVSGTAVALFVFAFVSAIQEGMDRLANDQAADQSLIVFQANRFCPSTSKLQDGYADRIRKIEGVKDAVPIKVYMNNCRASLDVVVFNGMPPEKLRTFRDLTLLQGDWATFEKQRDAALVGQSVFNRRKLKLGQKFSIGMLTVTVSGVFKSTSPGEDAMIFTHLEFLQRTKGLASVGTCTQVEVALAPGADPKKIAATIDDLYRGGPVPTDTRTRGVFQAKTVGDLVELVGFTQLLGFACVGLVLALVSTTTIMGVQDRINEHAVLQTLGCTSLRIFRLVLAESSLVSLIGGLVGVAAALITLHATQLSLGTEGILISFLPSTRLAITGVVVSAAVGVVAGLIPAWQAGRADIVSALRS
ncbi:ABC transporter permease YtrF precursor [Caulifigura coniformis]|uniref:ABC transporter permease YtrF n=1 Tax=Caulifigura coniformis TaxID=2527983 RepID=A0A517S9G8_9PLAN|nr:ABC transporter permease [Caulifigura coniformis]QDT52769.1 ABC transporter permease YtrF precursor [Caulifigura coniformis]